MFGLFEKSNADPKLLTWARGHRNESVDIEDKGKAFGRKLVFYGATAFLRKGTEKLDPKYIRTDVTIIEFATFFLFLADFAFHAKHAKAPEVLMRKIVDGFGVVLSNVYPEIKVDEFVHSRLNLYGEAVIKDPGSAINSSMKLLQKLINSSNQLKGLQYYKSQREFVFEWDPIYTEKIQELTSEYVAFAAPILDREIDEFLADRWER